MGDFVTGQAARERISVLLEQVDAAYAELRALSSDEVGNAFRVEVAERLETQERLNRGLMYRVFGEIFDPPDEVGMGRTVIDSLWARLRIPRSEVKRRMKTAALIRPRRGLTSPQLDPVWPELGHAVAAGTIGEDHLCAIKKVLTKLPSHASDGERADVEHALVAEAGKYDAQFVAALGRGIDEIFNPDGDFDEADRARRRGVTLGPQQRDGTSRLQGWVDPETRSYIEACTAAVRPGRHLPDGTVAEIADERSPAQRCHDGIKLGLKAGLASGGLGAHRGHPVTVIARTTLAELNQAAHAVHDFEVPMPAPARTGGGSVLPMRDLIRMAADAIHYLVVFDDHSERPLYLARQKRIATVDQRIICYARDGGCTRPACLVPGYHCEVHHSPDWTAGGGTDADKLFFACGPDHAAVTEGRLQTTITDTGRLGWSDGTNPPTINPAHHPEELLRNHDP